jgi:hypothetical protein
MSLLTLNKREVALIKSAARRGDDDSQFQELLAKLDKLVNDRTGQIQIPPDVMELVQHFGADPGKLSWHGTLYSIFGRTLGATFGRNSETCTELIDIKKEATPVSDDSRDRNWRAV